MQKNDPNMLGSEHEFSYKYIKVGMNTIIINNVGMK